MKSKEQAYIDLIMHSQPVLYKIASSYTNNQEDKNDLMQEMAYQIWKSFDLFENKSQMTTWLYRICLNTAIQSLKKEKRRVKPQALEGSSLAQVKDENQTGNSETEELFAAIQRLTSLNRGIILLYLEDRSHKEIADIIGISVSNVGTRIQRIKQTLKKDINQK